LAAAESSSKSAKATGSLDAINAYGVLTKVIDGLHSTMTDSGRCALDKYADWWNWAGGIQPGTAAPAAPPVPTTCAGLVPAVLDPFARWISIANAAESSEIAQNPTSNFLEYAQFDIASGTQAGTTIATLRASMTASGLTGADAATALAIEDAMGQVYSNLATGAIWALDTQAWIPGDARRAYEADSTAADYARALAALAGSCVSTCQSH
jgi:hypothetical protein